MFHYMPKLKLNYILEWSNFLILSSYLSHVLENAPFPLQNLKEKLIRYSEHSVEVDNRLICLEAEQEQAEQELKTLQGIILV